MGDIITTILKDRNLTILTIIGAIGNDEVVAHTERVTEETATDLVLWDFTRGDTTGLSPSRIPDGTVPLNRYASMRKEGRTAFVFARDADYGVGRMIESYLDIGGYPIEVQSFRSMDDAWKWLGVEPPEMAG